MAVLVLLVAAPAMAEPVVAVAPVDGVKADRVESQIRDLVRDEYRLASLERARRYFERKSYRRSPGKIAAKLHADAIVVAKLRKVRHRVGGEKVIRYRLKVAVYGPKSGELGHFKLYLRERSMHRSDRRELSRELARLVSAPIEESSRRTGEETIEQEHEPERSARKDRDDGTDVIDGEDEESSADRDDGDADVSDREDGDDESDEGEEEEEEEENDDAANEGGSGGNVSRRAPTVRPGGTGALEAVIGFNVASRSLAFASSAGLDDPPQGYSGSPFGGVSLTVEVYPADLSTSGGKRGALRNLGVRAHFERMLFIESNVAGRSDVTLPTDQWGEGVGVVYRHPFGDDPSSPTLSFGIGYNRLSFDIDPSKVPDDVVAAVPDVRYSYIDPGAALRFPVGELVALFADARFLWVTDAGDMVTPAAYGAARVTGLFATAGADIIASQGVFMRASVDARYFGFDFDGTGALSDRDNDGFSDVGGASDLYLAGQLAAGYHF